MIPGAQTTRQTYTRAATNARCPVCHAEPGKPCRALDFAVLPTVHLERDADVPTPIYDAMLRGLPS